MAIETLIFMPDGDVTLTLIRNVMEEVDIPSGTSVSPPHLSALGKSSSALNQASIDEDGRRPGDAPRVEGEEPAEPEESFLYFAPDPPESENGPFYPPPPRAARGSDASSRRDRSTSPPASFWASLKRQAARMVEPSEDEQPTAPPKPAKNPERIVVSSHQTILTGNFNEAITLRTEGHVSIPLSVDLDIIIILLNIIHGFSRKVPRQVSLEELSKLAILVSSFGMLETVQFFSDTWIDHFQREGLPKSYNENVLPLLYIFWVFDRPSEFKDMTRITQRQCDENLDKDVLDVPIPRSIINAIKRDREFAMETAITVIHALINKYMDGKAICDGGQDEESRYGCDAMVLGSLMKSSRKIGIWPKPEVPFSGRKFKELASAIRNIKVLDICNKTRARRLHSLSPSSNCHGLEHSIEASMRSIEAGLDGLELSDYAEKSEGYDFRFPMFLPSSEDELKEQTEDTKKTFQIYTEEEAVEGPKEEGKFPPRECSVSETPFLTPSDSREVREPAKEEAKVTPRQQSRDIQQPEARVSSRVGAQGEEELVKEAGKANPRNSLGREARMPATVTERVVDEPPKEEVKVLGDRKLNRTTSYPKIPKDDVKSPIAELQVAPRVASIEEMIAEVSQPDKEEVRPPTVEAKDILSEALTTTEDEEMGAPPQNFKMRKSKKRFSAKY